MDENDPMDRADMTDMEMALHGIWEVERNAPNAAAARERLMEIAVEAQHRADHIQEREAD